MRRQITPRSLNLAGVRSRSRHEALILTPVYGNLHAKIRNQVLISNRCTTWLRAVHISCSIAIAFAARCGKQWSGVLEIGR
ncbi:MAG TPA: hypothetical protein VGM26_02045 [Rhizomicrobium sp.]